MVVARSHLHVAPDGFPDDYHVGVAGRPRVARAGPFEGTPPERDEPATVRTGDLRDDLAEPFGGRSSPSADMQRACRRRRPTTRAPPRRPGLADMVVAVGAVTSLRSGGGLIPLDLTGPVAGIEITLPALYALVTNHYGHAYGIGADAFAKVIVRSRATAAGNRVPAGRCSPAGTRPDGCCLDGGAGRRRPHRRAAPMHAWAHLEPDTANDELRWSHSFGQRLDHVAAADAVFAVPGGVGTCRYGDWRGPPRRPRPDQRRSFCWGSGRPASSTHSQLTSSSGRRTSNSSGSPPTRAPFPTSYSPACCRGRPGASG